MLEGTNDPSLTQFYINLGKFNPIRSYNVENVKLLKNFYNYSIACHESPEDEDRKIYKYNSDRAFTTALHGSG